MRVASFAVLLVAGTALSGCAASQLDAVANLSAGCTSTTQNLNCGAPPATKPPPPPTPTTPPPVPNSGNTAVIVTGDTTLARERQHHFNTSQYGGFDTHPDLWRH